MDKDELKKIYERLENIEGQISMLFDEFKLRTPEDQNWSLNLYFSAYFTAQQIKEVSKLFTQIAVCDTPRKSTINLDDDTPEVYDVAKLRERFEAFRQRHLPYSQSFSLKAIAEGYIVQGMLVDLCKQLLADLEKNPDPSSS